MNTKLRLAALAYPVTAPPNWTAYEAKLTQLVAEGVQSGAQLLVMPEYACMELAAAGPHPGHVTEELRYVCQHKTALLDLWRSLAQRHNIWLLPGTLPWQNEDGTMRNRAPLCAPDGTIQFQDKSVMTRFEAESWGIQPGDPPRIFALPWGKTGISICYDVEFPTLVRRQTTQGAWLILAPSCTDSLHGFNRVRLSARARALENQCFVLIAPTVGLAPGLATLDENHGYAAMFGPVDRGFPPDGIIARGDMDQPGWVVADLDPAHLDAVRDDGAVRNFRDWPK